MTRWLRRLSLLAASLTAIGTSGCSAPAPLQSAVPGARPLSHTSRARSVSGGKIQHVVYIVQENRSFNNLFMGYPGATTQNYGYDTTGKKIKLRSQSIATSWDIQHSLASFLAAYDNGKLDGWNNEYACCGNPKNYAYAYAPRKETKTYWDMAAQYVLADQLFQSNLDGSYVAHQYAIAAYANQETDFPSGLWGCQGGPTDTIPTITAQRVYGPSVPVCENYQTLGDELDQASLSWRFYTYPINADGGLWNAYSAVEHIYDGPDYTNDIVSPAGQFVSDVAGGELAAVTWVMPNYANSDHAGFDSKGGPSWVASLVDAVGESKFWDSTAIFIIWDDWGGWFDPVAPIYMDYDGLGFRVPLIAISAYAKQGYVSHVQYESSSVLRFMEDNFGLSPLAASDARAVDPAADFFNFSQPARAFKNFPAVAPGPSRWNGVRPPVDGD